MLSSASDTAATPGDRIVDENLGSLILASDSAPILWIDSASRRTYFAAPASPNDPLGLSGSIPTPEAPICVCFTCRSGERAGLDVPRSFIVIGASITPTVSGYEYVMPSTASC